MIILKKIIKCFFSFIGIILIFIISFGFMFTVMYLIDNHAPMLANWPHNISGSVWFSAIASLLGATPGIMISLLALLQANEIQKLQDKMHRPDLTLIAVTLSEQFVNWKSYNEQEDFWGEQKEAIENYKALCNDCNFGLLRIRIEMFLKNDVSINNIKIEELSLKINGKKYIFMECRQIDLKPSVLKKFQKFNRKFEGGMEKYEIDWTLIQFIPDREQVWKEIYLVFMENELPNPKYEEVEATIKLHIDFATNRERTEIITLITQFDSFEKNDIPDIKQYEVYIASDNGRFVYNKK